MMEIQSTDYNRNQPILNLSKITVLKHKKIYRNYFKSLKTLSFCNKICIFIIINIIVLAGQPVTNLAELTVKPTSKVSIDTNLDKAISDYIYIQSQQEKIDNYYKLVILSKKRKVTSTILRELSENFNLSINVAESNYQSRTFSIKGSTENLNKLLACVDPTSCIEVDISKLLYTDNPTTDNGEIQVQLIKEELN